MKSYLSIALPIVCAVLFLVLVGVKWTDNSRHASDVAAFADCSNRLDAAQAQSTAQAGTIITLSNRLDECQSAAVALSNRLSVATAALALDAEQITNLNRQVTATAAENQALNQRGVDLTNQVAGLSSQLAQTQASLALTNQDLAQARKDYTLLDNRFRRDVAERVVVERKFNNPDALRAQLKMLKTNPAVEISAESIYAGLNVEVKLNGIAHVISPD